MITKRADNFYEVCSKDGCYPVGSLLRNTSGKFVFWPGVHRNEITLETAQEITLMMEELNHG